MKRITVRGRVLLNMSGGRQQFFEPKKVYEVDDKTAAHPYLVGRLSFIEDVAQKVEEPKPSPEQVQKAPTRRRKSK